MKIGVLGLGSIGKRHLSNAFEAGHDVEAYDPAFPNTRPRQELIEWADKIIIATPTWQHITDVISCNLYKKPMLVEKPLADAWSGCLFSEHIKLVGYNLRYHSLIQKAKAAIDIGDIGHPVWAHFSLGQLNNKPSYKHAGVIFNWSHEIDIALHLLGPAIFRSANVRQINCHDDIADILLTHANGCMTTIHLDYITNPWVRIGTVHGTKGSLSYDLEAGWLDLCGAVTRTSASEIDLTYQREMFGFLADDIGPGCTASEALAVMEICMGAKAT